MLRNAPTTALHTNRLATILVVDIRDYTPFARTVSEVSALADDRDVVPARRDRSRSEGAVGRRSTSATR